MIVREDKEDIGPMDKESYLASLVLFEKLDPEVIHLLAEGFDQHRLEVGETLFFQGDPGDAFYILMEGQLEVRLHVGAGLQSTVSILDPGECIGEMSLITGQSHTATVIAVKDCALLRLPKSAFEQITAIHPEILTSVAAQLDRRFRQLQANLAMNRMFGVLDERIRTASCFPGDRSALTAGL